MVDPFRPRQFIVPDRDGGACLPGPGDELALGIVHADLEIRCPLVAGDDRLVRNTLDVEQALARFAPRPRYRIGAEDQAQARHLFRFDDRDVMQFDVGRLDLRSHGVVPSSIYLPSTLNASSTLPGIHRFHMA